MAISIDRDDNPVDGSYLILNGYSFNNKGKAATVSVWRLYNPGIHDWLLTTSPLEKDSLIKGGWRYEGVAFTLTGEGTVPVIRLYNSKSAQHFFTTSPAERDMLVNQRNGWTTEMNSAFVLDEDGGDTITRFADDRHGGHIYTIWDDEKKKLRADPNFRDEGTFGHATSEVYALDARGGSLDNGTILQLHSVNYTDAQIWNLVSINGTKQRIVSRIAGNKAFDILGGWWNNGRTDDHYVNGQRIGLWYYDGAHNQDFCIAKVNGKTVSYQGHSYPVYKIITTDGAGKEWDVEVYDDNNTLTNDLKAGSRLSVSEFDASGADDHYWVFVPIQQVIPSHVYSIRPFVNPNMYLDVTGGINGSNVNIYAKSDSNGQYWSVYRGPTGRYLIKNLGAGRFLDVVGGVNDAVQNQNVQIYDLADYITDTELWDVTQYGAPTVIDGKEAIPVKIAMSGKNGVSYALDNHGNQNRSGNNVAIYANNDTDAQRWYMVSENKYDPEMPVVSDVGLSTTPGKVMTGDRIVPTGTLYPSWKSGVKWGHVTASTTYRVRVRHRYTATGAWTDWSDWFYYMNGEDIKKGWSPVVALAADGDDTGLPLAPDYDVKTYNNAQYDIQVKLIGIDQYKQTIEGGVKEAMPYATWIPTVDWTRGGVTPSGLHLEVLSNYGYIETDEVTGATREHPYGPTHVYVMGIYRGETASGENLLRKEYTNLDLGVKGVITIPPSYFTSMPDDDERITIQYQKGNDQHSRWTWMKWNDTIALSMVGTETPNYTIAPYSNNTRHTFQIKLNNPLGTNAVYVRHDGRKYDARLLGDNMYEVYYPFARNFTLVIASENSSGSAWYKKNALLNSDILRDSYGINTDGVHAWYEPGTANVWCIDTTTEAAGLTSDYSINAVYDARTTNAREYQMISDHTALTGEITASGALVYKTDSRDMLDIPLSHTSMPQFEALVHKHVIYRDIVGNMVDVFVKSVDISDVGHNTAKVTVHMIRETR